VAAAPAHADDSETFFAQGRALRADGNCADAVVAFRRALELRPQGLGSLRNVAECEESLGLFASARTDWWSLRRAVLQSNEPKYQGWDKDAEAAYRRLDAKVARLTVRLEGVSPERARITIDGKPLDPRMVGVELERDLGPHVVEASFDAAGSLVERRTLDAGTHEVVTLTIPAPAPGTATSMPAPAPAAAANGDEDVRRGRLKIAGIAALAAGGVGALGLGISAGVRASALSSFGVCAPSYQGCPSNLMSEQSKGQTASALANAFGVIMVAGVAAGVPLLVLGLRKGDAKTSEPPPTVSLSMVPEPGGAAIHAAWRSW
jgi:hypothetical protein